MTAYIIRRLIQAALVVLLVTIIIFLMIRLLPGDPILILISEEELIHATPERIAELRHEYGLDRPIVVQYFDWLSDVVRGDLGISIFHRVPVIDDIAHRLPITLHLGILAFILSIIIGIPLGVISAVRRSKWQDNAATTLANLGVTVPIFWLGIVMIYIFSVQLGVLPVFGYTSPFKDFWTSTKQLIMPVFCLSVVSVSQAARQTRSSMLEVMRQDYIRTAWAKGLRERVLIVRHALRNALMPVVTLQGVTFRRIIGGSVLIETVFNIPGIGRMVVDAVVSHDYPVVQGVVLIIAITVTLVNLLVDLSYGWLDPRVRYE